MKSRFLIAIFATLLLSCNDIASTQKQPIKGASKPLTYEQKLKIHLDTLKTFGDTVFLGFTLRDSKKKTQAHIQKLIKEGKTKGVVSYTVTLLGNSVIVGGYPYTLYFEGKKMETVFKPFYEDGKLYQIEIAMIDGGDSEYVVKAMNKKYGTGLAIKKDYSESFRWIKHNTEIEVGSGSLFTITYTDLTKSRELISKNNRKKNEEVKKGTKETSDAI